MSCRAEIAVYTLLGVLQSAASPALDTLAADPSFRAVAARAELTVPRLPSWAEAEGEEERLTRAVRFTVLREVAAAAAGRIAELAGEVEAGRLTVPAACELFAGELPDFGELAAEILARTAGEEVTADNPYGCNQHKHRCNGQPKTQPRYLGGIDPRHGREGKTRPREQRYSKLKHPAKNKDTAKRERHAAKLAKTPPGKVMTRLLASVRNKSETKNFSPLPQPINPVNRRTQARIHDITGINTSGWMHTASEQSLHHIQTEHALEIMQTDFHLIQEIQSQWNSLVLSEKNKRRCLEYKKKYGRRVFTLIEEIRPKSKSFAIITFYANKRK